MPRRTAEMSDYLCRIRSRIPLCPHNDPEFHDAGIPSLGPLLDVRKPFGEFLILELKASGKTVSPSILFL